MQNNEPLFYSTFGNKIEWLRRKKGLTQEDLAKELDLTRAAISSIERGKQRIYAHQLPIIAHALEVDISKLFPDFKAIAVKSKEKLDPKLRAELSKKLSNESQMAIAIALGDGHKKGGV